MIVPQYDCLGYSCNGRSSQENFHILEVTGVTILRLRDIKSHGQGATTIFIKLGC